MSKIQSVKSNFWTSDNFKKQKPNNSQDLSFSGTASAATKSLTKGQELLVDKMINNHYLGSKGRFLNFLSQTAGEVQNVWVMNIGTALVAPIFIANNPMTKEDKNSKKYAAWRQPISAVIALAFSLGINIPATLYMDRKAADGAFEKFDLSVDPPKAFLKKRYKGIKRHFENLKPVDKKYFDLVNDGKITSSKEFIEKYPKFELFHNDVKSAAVKKEAVKLLDRNNPNGLRHQTVKDFLVKNLKFKDDYVDKSILNPELTNSQLQKVKAMDFLRAFGYSADEVDEKSLRTFINNNLYKSKVKFNPYEKKYVTRVGESLISEDVKNSETITMKHLLKVLDMEDGFAKNKRLLNTRMDDFLMLLNRKLDIKSAVASAKSKKTDIKISKFNKKTLTEFLESHAKQIVKNAVGKSKTNYGSFGKLQGIVLSLITLPFSCGILNWVYPRIMERCFPKLTHAKQQNNFDSKGGKK